MVEATDVHLPLAAPGLAPLLDGTPFSETTFSPYAEKSAAPIAVYFIDFLVFNYILSSSCYHHGPVHREG